MTLDELRVRLDSLRDQKGALKEELRGVEDAAARRAEIERTREALRQTITADNWQLEYMTPEDRHREYRTWGCS